jgi:hypothetical protein
MNFARTKKTDAAYQKSADKAAFKQANPEAIYLHEEAKKFFDGKKLWNRLPTSAALTAELDELAAVRTKLYEDYKAARQSYLDLSAAKQNVDRLLSFDSAKNAGHPL